MLTLYYAPQTRSVRPRWLLEEIGLPYEIVRLDLEAGDQKRADYLKINPNGTVPAIVDGDVVLFESGAICQYLADKDPAQRMAPAPGTPARASYYQWIHYAMSGLEPPAVAIFTHTILRPQPERMPAVAEEARPRLAGALDVVDHALEAREFIVGDHLTAADVMIGSTAAWAMAFFRDTPRPNLSAYVTRLMGRPAYQRATAD